MLETGGYDVVTAASAAEALDVIKADGAPGLVITDVVMPGDTGLQLAERLAVVAPGTPVLLISGFVDDPELRASGASVGLPLLHKPFHPEELVQLPAPAMRPGSVT